jgi:hypothetical protein
MEPAKNRLLARSYDIVPLALGIAFSFSDYTYIGVAIILFISAWYALLNWRVVLSDTWALTVLGFFLAIALKDGLLYALGSGSFTSFAKTGSRVVVLAGAAGLLNAYSKPQIEDIFETALAILAGTVSIITILMRLGLIPWINNANTFGMSFVWFPLLLAYRIQKKDGKRASSFSRLVLLAGFAIVLFEAIGMREQGSRTAPLAFLAGAFFVLSSKPRTQKYLGYGLFFIAIIATIYFSLTFDTSINKLLANRQYLWNAFAHKGLQRIWTGWGWTDSAANVRIVGDYMKNTPFYQAFLSKGYGPHNALLAMFFENGLIGFVAYCVLITARIAKSAHPFNFFDISFMAFIVFFSLDAFAPGGLSFLGYFLGICLLAVERKPGIASEQIGSQQMSNKL